MIIRVDDYPWGNQGPRKGCFGPPSTSYPGGKAARAALGKFCDALCGEPFFLGVVFGWLDPEDEAYLRSLPQVHVAAHSCCHDKRDFENLELAAMMRYCADAPEVAIIPKNHLSPLAVENCGKAGFKAICNGLPYELGKKSTVAAGMRVIDPAFYGHASEFVRDAPKLGEWDCLALHFTWEWNRKVKLDKAFPYLEKLGKVVQGQVRTLSDFLAQG